MLIPSPDSELLTSRGLLATLRIAISLLLTRWRELLAVLLPVAVPVLLVRHLATHEPLASRFPESESEPISMLLLVGWCIAVPAGILVAAGGLRGMGIRWPAALARSLRSLLNTVVMVFLIGGLLYGGLGIIGVVLSQAGFGGIELLVMGALVLPLIAVAARLLLNVAEGVLGAGNVATLTRERFAAANGSIFVGVALFPWLIIAMSVLVRASLSALYGEPASLPLPLAVALLLIEDAALVAATALQAATLAVVYLQRHPGQGTVADLAKVGERLSGMARGTSTGWRGRRLGVALLAAITAPALVAGASVLLLPGDSFRATAHSVHSGWDLQALAWPQGQHPVVVTDTDVHWCHDDECSEYDRHHRNIFGFDGGNWVGVGPDRSVAIAAVQGRGGNKQVVTDGNDAVRLELCTQPDVCDHGITKWHTGGTDGQPHLAAMPGRDSSIVVASAHLLNETVEQRSGDKSPTVGIALTRCATVHCTTRHFIEFGTVEMNLTAPAMEDLHGAGWSDGLPPSRWQYRPVPVLELRVDDSNVPTVLLRDAYGGRAWIGSCDSPSCAKPTLTEVETVAYPTWPTAWLDQLPHSVTLQHGWLRSTGPGTQHDIQLGEQQRPGEGAIAVTAHGIYAVLVEDLPPRHDRFQLTFGEQPPRPARLVLWHCADERCEQPERIGLWEVEEKILALRLTADADGRVLIAYNDSMGSRAVLITR